MVVVDDDSPWSFILSLAVVMRRSASLWCSAFLRQHKVGGVLVPYSSDPRTVSTGEGLRTIWWGLVGKSAPAPSFSIVRLLTYGCRFVY